MSVSGNAHVIPSLPDMVFTGLIDIIAARGWTVRGARWGSIGLPVEASSFNSHLGVLSRAGWRLFACDWRSHVPRHG
ncbi:UNVERIFIED_CONTAM: hypothetical protein Sradi_1588300 [Sesamum radiatum]|uniref:Uncharacterized protein n=1 Tax=Sesamum radiatum TaxID=300843 RepID=A0AAW2UDA3_SESRA